MKFRLNVLFAGIVAGVSLNAAAVSLPDSTMKMPAHPRLILFKGEEAAIRTTIASAPVWARVDKTILSFCDDLHNKETVQRELVGKRLLGQARECLHRVLYLSYAWRMTGKEVYLRRAEKEMLAAASFSDWNPSHFLDVAELTMALSFGYDWLYTALPPSSRQTIEKAIVGKGLKPSLDSAYNSWLGRNNNWNQVCNAGMIYGALAVYESEPALANRIIRRSIESTGLPMKAYNPDGAYNEGYGYWEYGTTFNIMLLCAVEKIYNSDFGLLDNKGFFKSAAYMTNLTGPTGEAFNYSDNGSSPELHPAMFWFAARLHDNSLLWNEKKFIAKGIASCYKFLPMMLIWAQGIDLDKVPEPKETMWVGKGSNPVALMRTSWTDTNAVFVGVKGGTCAVGHSHMDIGSFVMDADGVRWAMDFGAQGYNSLESKGVDLWNSRQNSQRWQVFRYNNLAHNTLTVNNRYQRVDGYAPLTGFSADPGLMSATFDLSEVYKGQLAHAGRTIAIVNKQYVVIKDELETSDTAATIRWNLLTSASVTLKGNGAELSKNGKKLILNVRKPAKVVMKTWTTTSPNDYDAPNPGTTFVGFEVTLPAGTKTSFAVYMIPERKK